MNDIYEHEGANAESGRMTPSARRIQLTKKQRDRFCAAADGLHKRDRSYRFTNSISFILYLICVVIGAFALRQFFFEPTVVDGESMQYTLLDGERVFVEKVSYWFQEPERGDIVIVHYPNRTECFVKRIIAFGGERICIRDGHVYVNDELIDESAYIEGWIQNYQIAGAGADGTYVVPYGSIFVMGDNRNWSHDSRAADVGPIAVEQVLGKAHFVLWPFSSARRVDVW